MNLLDRYLLREWLAILFLLLGATLGLLLMQALYDDFRSLLDVGASAGDIAFYYAIKMPSYLSVVLPLALLLSLLYTLGRMHRHNEIIAQRAAGLGLLRITRSLWAVGAGLCVLTWYLNANVVPWSVEESRRIWEHLQYAHQVKSVTGDQVGVRHTVAFDNQRDGRMWYFNRYSRYTRRGYGVMVSELDSQRRETTRLVAREAWRDPERGYWVFREGRENWIDPETGVLSRTVAFTEKAFPHFREDPELMLVFDMKPQDLSFLELRRIMDYFAVEENPKVSLYATRYYSVVAETLGPLIILALAIPFAVAGVRVNPAVGVSKSIGLFLLYFLLVKTATALGGRAVIPPEIAAWAPNLAMLGVGGWFFLKLR